jgi:hypothetical protein
MLKITSQHIVESQTPSEFARMHNQYLQPPLEPEEEPTEYYLHGTKANGMSGQVSDDPFPLKSHIYAEVKEHIQEYIDQGWVELTIYNQYGEYEQSIDLDDLIPEKPLTY